MSNQKKMFPSLIKGYFRPCCIKCEEINRNARNRFFVNPEGLVTCKTTYCTTCKACIIDWINKNDDFVEKTSQCDDSEKVSNEMEKFFWTLSHCKKGYFNQICDKCFIKNQLNENRFVISPDESLIETMIYCDNCILCNSECTESYRKSIAKQNSEIYNNNSR